MLTLIDCVVSKLNQITQEWLNQTEATSSFGHVLGYKWSEENVFGLQLAQNNVYSVFYSVAVYVLGNDLSDEQIIEGVSSFINRKNGKILIVQSKANEQGNTFVLTVRQLDLKLKQLESHDHRVVSLNQYTSNCISFRVRGQLPIKITCSNDKQQVEKDFQAEIDRQTKLARKAPFRLLNSEFTMNSSATDSSPITELYSHIKDEYTEQIGQVAGSKKAREKMLDDLIKQRTKSKEAFEFNFGEKANESIKQEDNPLEFKSDSVVEVTIPIDYIFIVDQNALISSLARLLDQLYQSVFKQLKELYLPALTSNNERHVPQVKFFNFWPRDVSAATFTIAFPTHLSEEQLVERRREICTILHLPLNRPSIRRANAFDPELLSNSADRPLLNPHSSLMQAAPKGKYHVVQGTYTYHHYMQDGFNDNGWGCAYRSLQTLISWFAHQGYAQIKRIPTHNEIQKVLVDIGDKPATFIGSKQWIGSQEVGYVLNQLYAIESKFMCVSSGSELESKGRQLALHFDTQGTPIMIGGGNLAHTILGVDFNEDTGKLRFLVLDPHYTGSEDLNTILKKNWCGWQEPKFWDKNSFYNLCMPQRPSLF